MNICILYLGRKGGGASYALEMTKALLRNDEVSLFAILSEHIENRKQWEILAKEKHMKLCFLPTYTSKLGFIKSFLPINSYRKCVWALKQWGPQVIYLPMLSLNAWKILFQFNGIEIVTTIHDLYPHPGEQNILQRIIFEKIKKKSTKYVVLTESFKQSVSRLYKVSINKVCFIPHGRFCFSNIHPPQFNSIRHRVLFFGRITPYKGVLILLKAMLLLKERIPEIQLTIAGKGELSPEESKIISDNSDRIELINDWISEETILKLFDKSDITILPYTEASQSGVAAISYGLGRTIIASDAGGLKEQIEEGGGRIFKSGDYTELANTIYQMYQNPQLITQLNIIAYNYSQKELSWDTSASKLINFLNND